MRYHRLKRIETKSGDAQVKNGILAPRGEKKRRIHRISEVRKKDFDNKREGKIMAILKGSSSKLLWSRSKNTSGGRLGIVSLISKLSR
ncbi:hypothetical protein Tco_1179030 [Tanacetum coccineum]